MSNSFFSNIAIDKNKNYSLDEIINIIEQLKKLNELEKKLHSD